MDFTGLEDFTITLAAASTLTANYRAATAVTGRILGGYFGKTAISNILNQTGCVGMRYYYGLDATGVPVLVICGVDASGNDLCNGLLAEMSVLCPNVCSNSNPLNS